MKAIKMMDFYTKGKRLGAGKFGVTILCTEIATGQHYACKCISKCVSQKTLDMVQREIDILWWISLREHPNIISIKDVFEDHLYIYIVMELCEGGMVYDRMNENEITFGEPRVAQMIKDIVCAIEVCHSFGIVHRDLKPKNLMFQTKDKDSAIKIIDFGLAQVFEQDEVLIDVVGTPFYLAPEVIKHNHGPKADIWSIGVILFDMLLGLVPVSGNTSTETDKDITETGYEFDVDPLSCISEGAKDLLQKMLNVNVNERLSASDVLKHPWILENVK